MLLILNNIVHYSIGILTYENEKESEKFLKFTCNCGESVYSILVKQKGLITPYQTYAFNMVQPKRLELLHGEVLAPEASASANSAMAAWIRNDTCSHCSLSHLNKH